MKARIHSPYLSREGSWMKVNLHTRLPPDGTEGYVRLHVLSDGGKALFTQPFFLSAR